MGGINSDPEYDVLVSGNITAISQSVVFDTPNKALQSVQITGTWSGTIQFEATNDGTNWFTVKAVDQSTLSKVTSTTTNGTFLLVSAGHAKSRVVSTAWTSGTASVNAYGSDITSVVYALQSDVWNINNISGVISLPTGAATETTLSAINTKLVQLALNYGVATGALRTASQIGNTTGAADFNAGATGAQTLRTVANQGAPNTNANGWFQRITDGADNAKVTTNQDLSVSDGLRNGGLNGTLSLVTANTAYEAKVGGSRLANRKSLVIVPQDNMFWGYDNTVTTSNGIPVYKDQPLIFSIDPDSTFQIWLVASASTKTAKIGESP